MKKKGLCSVTFRNLSVDEIIQLVQETGLECIEWGGDIHVPTGNITLAKEVGEKTRAAGIEIYSYGSYYRCDGKDFDEVSRTAEALGAKIIRVWAGNRKDAEMFSEEEKRFLIEDIRKCAEIAEKRNQIVAFEFHAGTYNMEAEKTFEIIKGAGKENVKTYWQPFFWHEYETPSLEFQGNLETIQKLKEEIVCVHMNTRRNHNTIPVGEDLYWKDKLEILPDVPVFLEFVKNGELESFYKDIASMKELI